MKRIKFVIIDGAVKPIFHTKDFGRIFKGVHVTRETPQHAASSIRKRNAYKRQQMQSLTT